MAHFSVRRVRGRGIRCGIGFGKINRVCVDRAGSGQSTHHEVLGVEDIVGEDVVGEHLGGTDGGDVRGDGLGRLGDVGDAERGHARERLG